MIITGTNHTVQKLQGEFIIKDQQTPMTMINKKTITITPIILNNPSIQRTLNKLVINFSTIQINYAQNDACT